MKLETAKELKRIADDFGVILPISAEYGFYNEDPAYEEGQTGVLFGGEQIESYPAYTADELLEWLPWQITAKVFEERVYNLVLTKNSPQAEVFPEPYVATYQDQREPKHCYSINYADTPSEALALLAIELIKNKVIK